MTDPGDLTSLEQLVNRIRDGSKDMRVVSVAATLDLVGQRSFGPLVVLAGLITLAPLIGDIPGVPTIMGILVTATIGQLLFRRQSIWLPRWLAERNVPRDKLVKGLEWLRPAARFIDRWTRPRLIVMVRRPGLDLMALCCIGVALLMPMLELIPFSANLAGLAWMAYGLAMIARDGLIAMVALVTTGGALMVVISGAL
ncbi:MAG: exopolysaccharide biosynthesis protein [Marinobacter sp.]|uniref:exopolysaccharide biosynthesis protein n=1 Tax=Marinobacter sp. TaxID=50741 RepID=UPI00299DAE27|nr:exopolysaccharide biosynthesis protein [Marinobacter sp.]MDX1635582.1 exopolysaccharide biosynthesis protein [Marinobacter sp.]